MNKIINGTVKEFEIFCCCQETTLIQNAKENLKLNKYIALYSDTLKKLKNTEFKSKSVTKNIDLISSQHTISISAFKVI